MPKRGDCFFSHSPISTEEAAKLVEPMSRALHPQHGVRRPKQQLPKRVKAREKLLKHKCAVLHLLRMVLASVKVVDLLIFTKRRLKPWRKERQRQKQQFWRLVWLKYALRLSTSEKYYLPVVEWYIRLLAPKLQSQG